jgi:DNA-binding transcriptional ArsR family regulator
MVEESFLMVSLEEDKAKQLAQVLSNDTARKILDYLSKKDHSTETEISKDMNLPLSTAHYNIQLLVKANLVNADDYTYSEKGKEIIHYSLSNKYVIIAPRKNTALLEKLKEFLPVVLLATAASVLIKYLWQPALEIIMQRKAEKAADMLLIAPRAAPVADITSSSQEFALFFLAGSVFSLLIYFVWTQAFVRLRKKK